MNKKATRTSVANYSYGLRKDVAFNWTRGEGIDREACQFGESSMLGGKYIAVHGGKAGAGFVPSLGVCFAAASGSGSEDVFHQFLSDEFRRDVAHLRMSSKLTSGSNVKTE